MSVVINTNVDSIKIQGCLNSATSGLSGAMERMSTGLKVNSAKDDAAGCVISERMKVQLNGNQIAQKNIQNANAMMSTMEGNIDVVLDNVSRIRDLTLQAKNGTYSKEEIQAMQDEVSERISEINRISDSSKYSQIYLFEDDRTDVDGYTSLGLKKDGVTFQVGANKEDDNTISAGKELFASVKFSTMTSVSNFNLTTMTKADMATNLGNLDTAIDDLTNRKSIIGSAQNRLESALDTLTTQYENLSSANSIIVDADVASEASDYTKQQILQQVSTSLLAQANQAPSIALSLV